ncbi:MAG: putative toxin-antitoxin system toxin component, PIN family [Nanoarchaeota archaeon]|nr:putative toxin-antitoxin system toxin component, PIN family [Nanoarchaeota archaeon]
MLKITVDTNILVSATIVRGNEFELLKLAKEGKIKLILSLDIIKEFREVISRPKFSYPVEFINDEVKKILEISEIVFPTIRINVIKKDVEDNKILECAVAGNSYYIISGDQHLLKLKKYKDIKIVKCKELLEELKV